MKPFNTMKCHYLHLQILCSWLYSKITVSLKFLLFHPIPKGDKRNFILVSVQKWDTPFYVEYKMKPFDT
jgi:hypothetical protein